jgi:multidrug efflux pump subunit AcrB/outer membrane protein TolC
MSGFSIRYPYLVIVACLMVCVVGVMSVARMPVDLFPSIKIPVVVVATFFNGMPPEQIESAITSRFERFFTLGSGIEHIESRSLPGVSLIKVFFQPGTNADSAVTSISNLAMANLRRLPPGTLPPVVLKFDASSLPVCLITMKGEGLNESQLRDLGQYTVRNQVANVQGASVPQPFGGRYRQMMVYVDPLKLEAHQLSVMDVVRSVNESNLILPAGNIRVGPTDYSLYTNSQLKDADEINTVPLKTVGGVSVLVGDVAKTSDSSQIQTNIVRIDGQRSAYLPVLKQGGDANTISVVEGIKAAVANLVDIPKSLVCKVVFDQSVFVKTAIENLLHEGAIGLVLTGIMILLFLGSFRATLAVFLAIPLSALATFIGLSYGDSSINSMILGGLALAFSRLIDNSVVVLENIFRHLELGETPEVAAEKGGSEVALPVLAATLTTAVVFFPVTFLYGVSRFLFSALALSVVLSLFASYVVAMTVVPLFCAKLIKGHGPHHDDPAAAKTLMGRFNSWFNALFERFLNRFDRAQTLTLARPIATMFTIGGVFLLSLCLIPKLGLAYFPRTDPGQFVINLKTATGTRLEFTEQEVQKVEELVRRIVTPEDLRLIASNIGATPDFSSIYTSNSASHTAFVQVSLHDEHKVGSYEYMDRVRKAMREELPQLSAYFQSGGLVDAVLNLGLPAPIDIQVSGSNMEKAYETAVKIAKEVRAIPGVSDVLIPQDIDAPAFRLTIDRAHASELGLSQKEVVSNVITALSSNQMIAPSFWVDSRTGNDYLLTVQYPESTVKTLGDLRSIPIRAANHIDSTRLDAVTSLTPIQAPTEVDHYQLRRVIDVYVAPQGEELGRISRAVNRIVANLGPIDGIRITVRGSVQAMNTSFVSFGRGLILAVVLVYLILVAQFKSFVDPLLILLAIPPGIAGVLVILTGTDTTLNVMSLMGIVMMAGIVVSNSILIVEFTHRLIEDGMPLKEAIQTSCRVRLRPILMTSLATVFGLFPMALKMGTGSEAYAPLAKAIIGGLLASLVMTVFIVPAAFLVVYRKRQTPNSPPPPQPMPQPGSSLPIGALALLVISLTLASTATATELVDGTRLDLKTAESIAQQRAPAIAGAYLRSRAAAQVTRQTRGGLYPQLTGEIALVGTADNISDLFGGRALTGQDTRIGTSGGLNNPTIFGRESNGVRLSQLLTDFGRTNHLVSAASLESLSEDQRAKAIAAQVLLLVDKSYFHALEAEALIRVTKATISNRKLIVDRTSALVESKLKSEIDASLARVSLEESQLTLLQADNNRSAAFAELCSALGCQSPLTFILEEEMLPHAETKPLPLHISEALANRPEIIGLRYKRDAALKIAAAEKAARYPKVSLLSAFGRTTAGDSRVRQTYGAAGVIVELPMFTGGRISARAEEASLKAQAEQKALTETEDRIVRDVRLAWLNVETNKKRIEVTKTLLASASQSWDLARARYESGIASIVELSQAEYARNQAELASAVAVYEFQLGIRILDYQSGKMPPLQPPAKTRH